MLDLIDLFNTVASPYLEAFPAAACIEQSRILVEVLRALDVSAVALETALKVYCPQLRLAYVAGADAETRKRAKAVAREWTERTTHGNDAVGHVVVAAQLDGLDYLIDSTLAQASAPERGLSIPRCTMALGPLSQRPAPGCQIDAGLDLDGDKQLDVTWIVRDTRAFEETPAWEPSHLWPLIHLIVREMNWAETVMDRIRDRRAREGGAI